MQWNIIKKKRHALLFMSAVMSLSGTVMECPAQGAWVKEPGVEENAVPDDYDAKTWEALQDNVLEYEELEDRIKEFNPNMISADWAFQSAMNDVKNEYLAAYKEADDYKDDADDLRDSGGLSTAEGQIMYGTLRAYEKVMKSTGDQISRAYRSNTRADASSYESIREGAKQLTSAAQQVMIGYSTASAQRDTLLTMKEMYERLYDSTVSMKNSGMATEVDVTAARKNLITAENSLASLDNTIESLRSTLCLLTGLSEDNMPQIQPVPSADLSKITEMDLEKDTETAIRNNYTLISERHIDSDKSTAGINAKLRSEEQNEQSLSIEMEQLYQDIMEKKIAYEAALTAYDQAVVGKNAAEIQLQNGSISQIEYLGKMLSYYQADGERTGADLALRQAMEMYYWATEGLVYS